MLTGCLSRPTLKVESFAFEAPSGTAATAAGTNVLVLKNVSIAPAFEGQQFVYRTGDQSYERDPYAEFLVPPARMLTGTIAAHLRQGGVFRDVFTQGSGLKTSRLAEVHLTEMYGDFRKPEEAFAVMTLRFVTLVPNGAAAGQSLWQREISRRIPLKQRSASAVAAGWNEALGQILTEINAALKSLP